MHDLNIGAADDLVYPAIGAAPDMAKQIGHSNGNHARGDPPGVEDLDGDWRDYDARWAAVKPRAPGAPGFGEAPTAAAEGGAGGRLHGAWSQDIHADLDGGCYSIRWAHQASIANMQVTVACEERCNGCGGSGGSQSQAHLVPVAYRQYLEACV